MSKFEFMSQLENLLLDIPFEEREAALKYYEDYFEDAGVLNEQDVIKELVSPERVAETIKSDLSEASLDKGEFTEHGYRDNSVKEDKCEIVDSVIINESNTSKQQANDNQNQHSHNQKSEYQQTGYQQSSNQQGTYGQNRTGQNYQQNQTNQGSYQQNQYQQSQYQNNNGTKKKETNVLLIIALVLLAVPVGIPFICSVFGLFIGLLAATGGIFIGFLGVTLALLVAGIALIVWGFTKLVFIPAVGAVLIGTGLILFAIGLLFAIASVFICSKVIPTVIRGFVNLCRLPFKNRSVTA